MTVPASMSERCAVHAAAAGDDASYLPIPGAGHLEMIDPTGRGWAAAAGRLVDWL